MALALTFGAGLLFILGLWFGGALSGSEAPEAGSTETTLPPTSATTPPTTTTTTSAPVGAGSSTTTTTPPSSTTTSWPPDWVLSTDTDPNLGFAVGRIEPGDSIDLETWTSPCSSGCDLQLVEVLAVSAEGYNAVFQPINGAEMRRIDNPYAGGDIDGFVAAMAVCTEGQSGFSDNKDILLNTPPDGATYWLCIHTGDGNWAFLVTVPGYDPQPAWVTGLAVTPPGFIAERLND